MGTQKNRLYETILLSTQNKCLMGKKKIQICAHKISFFWTYVSLLRPNKDHDERRECQVPASCGNRDKKQETARVKSGMFGHTAKFGQSPCLFHSSNIGINYKLTKQTVKILMRRLKRSRLIWISTVCKRVSEFT